MRFVRVMPSEDPKLAGERLRIEREAPGELCDLVDETVWPEQVENVDANRRKITERLMLTDAQQIWLRDCLIEMHGAPLSEQERCHLLSIRSLLAGTSVGGPAGALWRAEIATLDLLLGGVAL